MNDDVIKELLLSIQEDGKRMFTILEKLVSGLSHLEGRVKDLESKDVVTKPLWQEMRADQQRILNLLQEHGPGMDRLEAHLQRQDERMDRIEAHLQQQDEKFVQWDEQMDTRFRKLTDKFDLLLEDTLEWRADVRDLKRRVTRLEPIN